MHGLDVKYHSHSRSAIEIATSKQHIEYSQAIAFMKARVDSIINYQDRGLIWLLEHPDTYTAGLSSNAADLIDANISPLHQTDRGGKYTYHGPGQRVIYFMLDLKKLHNNQPDIRRFILEIGNVLTDSLNELGINAYVDTDAVGVWVSLNGIPKKIASFGFKLRKWVTYHGVAINVTTDMSKFNVIMPCGFRSSDMASISEINQSITMLEFDEILTLHLTKLYTKLLQPIH